MDTSSCNDPHNEPTIAKVISILTTPILVVAMTHTTNRPLQSKERKRALMSYCLHGVSIGDGGMVLKKHRACLQLTSTNYSLYYFDLVMILQRRLFVIAVARTLQHVPALAINRAAFLTASHVWVDAVTFLCHSITVP